VGPAASGTDHLAPRNWRTIETDVKAFVDSLTRRDRDLQGDLGRVADLELESR
jgi:hypothetical protein